jgi:hypothetical protein
LAVALLLALAPATAQATTQIVDDPADAPTGPVGKADLRRVAWDVAGASANLTISVDASTYGAGIRAPIGIRTLLDTDGDGIADREIAAIRDADGVRVDMSLRALDGTLSTADCQDLAGKSTAIDTVSTVIASGLETFTFSFDPTSLAGGLSTFRWAAIGQAPSDAAEAGPWDVMPDAANPEPVAANPGDRRCDGAKSGISVRMSQGVAFPDPSPPGAETLPGEIKTLPDSDGDGVIDATDVCVQLKGSSANGCPDIARLLSLTRVVAGEKLKGTLGPAGGCASGETVRLYRVKPGRDQRIGTATTKQSGRFKLTKSARAGRYYAIVGPRTIVDVGNCLPTQSKRIVVDMG